MNDSSTVEIGEEFNEFLDFQETLVTKQLNEEGTKILPILNPTITTTIVDENVLVDSKPDEKLKMQTTEKNVLRKSLRIQSIVVVPMHSFPAIHCSIPPSQPPLPLYRFTGTNFDPGGDKHRFRDTAVNSGNFHYKPSLLQIPWDRGKSIVYDFVISFKLFNWFTPVRSNTPPVTIFDSCGDMSGMSAISGGSICIFSLLWLPWDRGKDDWKFGIAASYFWQWIYFRREALVLISRFTANRTGHNCTFILGQVANNNWAFQQDISATTHKK
jgi:hypothetical protein